MAWLDWPRSTTDLRHWVELSWINLGVDRVKQSLWIMMWSGLLGTVHSRSPDSCCCYRWIMIKVVTITCTDRYRLAVKRDERTRWSRWRSITLSRRISRNTCWMRSGRWLKPGPTSSLGTAFVYYTSPNAALWEPYFRTQEVFNICISVQSITYFPSKSNFSTYS